jgi:hypothetical protein
MYSEQVMAEIVRRTQPLTVGIDDVLVMWTDYDLEVRGDRTIDFEISVGVRFNAVRSVVELQQLEVFTRPGGPEVSGAGLRTLRLRDYVRATPVMVSQVDPDGAVRIADVDAMIATAQAGEEWKATRLRWVYRLHRIGQFALRDPALEVQRRLDLPPSTATRWIREARDGGYFDPPGAGLVEVLPDTYLSAPTTRRIDDRILHGDS